MSSAAPAIPAPVRSFSATLAKAGAIYKRDRRIATSYDMAFIIQWLQIVVQVLGFYYMSKLFSHPRFGGFSYWVINLGFSRFQMTALQSFQTAIRGDQMLGTLECVLVTPTSLATVVMSPGLWGFTLTAMQVLLYIVLGATLGVDFSHTNYLTLVVFVILTIACMSPLGVMAASTIMTFKQNAPTQFVAGSAAQLLGGVLFPVALLPVPLQWLSWLLPITHSLNGVRAAIGLLPGKEGMAMHGAALPDPAVAADAIWLVCATAILMPLSLFIFSRAVNRARRDGTLGHY
ncbi:MAG: ABC transporter permease [Candidatus Eremiobacterales bacterium]